MHSARKYLPWIAGAAVCAAVALVYLTTVQTDVNGLDDLMDTGEFQNALYLWGIVHPTGYPLYLLVGGAFVHLLHALGVNPAAAASLFSTVGALATLALFFASVEFQTRQTGLAAASTVVLASGSTFWSCSLVAEVYTWAFFFVALALYLTLRFVAQPRPSWLLALLFALGTGIAHHRLVVLIFPAILVAIGQEAWRLIRARRSLAVASVLALILPFAVYLYLPLRAYWGTTWEFVAADTWDGFWSLFLGVGYTEGALEIPASSITLFAQLEKVLNLLAAQLTPVGLGVTSLAVMTLWAPLRARRLAAFVTLGVITAVVFAVLYQIDDIDAYLAPATMLLVFGAMAAVTRWSEAWKGGRVLTAAGALGLALLLVWNNYPKAQAVGSNQSGRELLNAVQALGGPQTVLVAPWGTDFFVFWYGKYVTGEIAPKTALATPDAPIRRFLNQGLEVYASKDIFYTVSPDEWDQKLGRVYLRSAGPGIVEISNHPARLPTLGEARGEATFGSAVTLVEHRLELDPAHHSLRLTLFWRAEQDITQDYSMMVHLVDEAQGDLILTQADSTNPVYGFYPTSRWQEGEIVRDDYQVPLPRGISLEHAALVVGWYRQDPSTSTFQDLGSHRISLPPESE